MLYQDVSGYIGLYQASNQAALGCIRLYRLYQSVSVCIRLYLAVSGYIWLYQTVTACFRLYQIAGCIKRYWAASGCISLNHGVPLEYQLPRTLIKCALFQKRFKRAWTNPNSSPFLLKYWQFPFSCCPICRIFFKALKKPKLVKKSHSLLIDSIHVALKVKEMKGKIGFFEQKKNNAFFLRCTSILWSKIFLHLPLTLPE